MSRPTTRSKRQLEGLKGSRRFFRAPHAPLIATRQACFDRMAVWHGYCFHISVRKSTPGGVEFKVSGAGKAAQ
jgi:hypothetical protein